MKPNQVLTVWSVLQRQIDTSNTVHNVKKNYEKDQQMQFGFVNATFITQ